MLQVASAAWFWSEEKKLNVLADKLKFDGSDNNQSGSAFYQITQKVNGRQNGATERFRAYERMQGKSTENGNSYESMRSVLSRLGLSAQGANGYKDQFGITLNSRTSVPIIAPANLLADGLGNDKIDDFNQVAHLAEAMSLSMEDLKMFIDMPMLEAGAPSAYVVAQAQTSQAASQNLPNQLGVCSEYRANATHSVAPIFDAKFYINEFKKGPNVLVTENGLIKIRRDATIRIVKQPSHGNLVLYKPDANADDLSKYDYNYLPNKDYVGEDNFQFDISLEGKTLRVYYQVMVFPEDENPNYVGFCNWEKPYNKISSTTPALDNASLQALLSSANIDSSVNVTFSDLAGGALGQTTGTTITLDTNAAGYNWYIDPTPWDNSEYLATSNPDEWVAKAGSDAAGKMDMLSVLLHEYGHALGIDHSADNHDYMATTLTPGVRRMPSAEEMALMQSLVGQLKGEMVADGSTPTLTLMEQLAVRLGWQTTPAKSPVIPLQGGGDQNGPLPLPIPLGAGFGMAFIGRMRKGSYGSSIDVVGVPPDPKYAVAANATFDEAATLAEDNLLTFDPFAQADAAENTLPGQR